MKLLSCFAGISGISRMTLTVLTTLIGCVFSVISFLLPTLLLQAIRPAPVRRELPLSPRLPSRIGLWIFAGLAVVLTAACGNEFLFRFIPSSGSETAVSSTAPWEIALSFITSVLLPAFLEELFFRGAVLTALLPYGNTVAILGSALTFGLCHQNPGQFFYATVAGVFFGYLCIGTGSLWCGLLIHFFNNLFSLAETVIQTVFPAAYATRAIGLVRIIIIYAGIVSICLLLKGKHFPSLPAEDGVPEKYPLRAFCSPLFLCFVLYCLWDTLEILWLWLGMLF